MSQEFVCYRCNASLTSLSLPLSRHDECPACSVYLHVCAMCKFFDKNVPKQCREDDAEEVHEKERANFCEWFGPGADAFDSARVTAEHQSSNALASLFGIEEEDAADDNAASTAAEDLFK